MSIATVSENKKKEVLDRMTMDIEKIYQELADVSIKENGDVVFNINIKDLNKQIKISIATMLLEEYDEDIKKMDNENRYKAYKNTIQELKNAITARDNSLYSNLKLHLNTLAALVFFLRIIREIENQKENDS